MIVADTSAIVAIVFAEPERDVFVRVIQRAQRVLVSTVSVVEARMVVHGTRGQRAVVLVDDLLRLPMFEAMPPGASETDAAYAAFVAFGEGNRSFGSVILRRRVQLRAGQGAERYAEGLATLHQSGIVASWS